MLKEEQLQERVHEQEVLNKAAQTATYSDWATVRAEIKRYYPFVHMANFFYSINTKYQQIYHQANVLEYLGYKAAPFSSAFLSEILHPRERNLIQSLTQRIVQFLSNTWNGIERIIFVIGHRFRRKNGSYINVLRYIEPIPKQGNESVIYNCYCVDISQHHFSDRATIDVVLPSCIHSGDAIRRQIIQDIEFKEFKFTKRQLEVIQTWSETDSVNLAAEQLNISVRTLETHLKNMRQKIGVRRTVDVLVYVREQGWI